MNENWQILKKTVYVTAIGGITQIIGFFIPILIANFFGTSSQVDAYYFAISIPLLIIGIIVSGSLKIIFIPIFIEEKEKNPENINIFIGQITTFLIIISLIIIAGIAVLLEFGVLNFLNRRSTIQYTHDYILILLPLIPITIIFNLYNAIYNAYQKFALFEISNAIKYIITIICILLLHERFHILSAIYGQLLGQFVALVFSIVILKLSIKVNLRPQFIFNKSQINLLKLSSLSLGAFVFAQLNTFITKVIAGFLQEGSISIIGYVDRLSTIPTFIIGGSFSMILTSYWSVFVVNKKSEDLNNSFNKTISALSIILFPISIGLYYLAEPIVQVIYQRGSFDINTAIITAKVFALFSIQIIPLYYNNVLSRILHVNKSLNYLFIFSMVAFILNTLLMYCLSIYTGLGILGIPIGLIIGRFSMTAVNFLYVNYKYVDIHFKDLGIKNFKSMLATTVMIASLIIFNKLIELYGNYMVQVVILIINMVLGAFVYFVILKLLSHPEFETIIMMLRKKLGKSN